MKTVKEFYKEFASSKELQEELKAASDEMLETFLKKHGCNATAKDFTAFVKAQNEGEIEDADAALASGGAKPSTDRFRVLQPLKLV